MCIHNEDDLREYNNSLKRRGSPMRVFAVRDQRGKLIGGWAVNYDNPQGIANTVRDVKSWHGGKREYWADLQNINEARAAKGLELLDRDGLPIPVGEPLSQDMDVDLVIRGRDGYTEFERGLQRYVKAQARQLEMAGVGA